MTLADKVKQMAHCAVDAGITDAVDWSADSIEALEKQEAKRWVIFNKQRFTTRCINHKDA